MCGSAFAVCALKKVSGNRSATNVPDPIFD
jgi:hypothetical protein